VTERCVLPHPTRLNVLSCIGKISHISKHRGSLGDHNKNKFHEGTRNPLLAHKKLNLYMMFPFQLQLR